MQRVTHFHIIYVNLSRVTVKSVHASLFLLKKSPIVS